MHGKRGLKISENFKSVIFVENYKSFVTVEVHTNYCRNTKTSCLKFQVQLFFLTDVMVKTLKSNVSIFCCRSADIGKEFLFSPKILKNKL